MSVAMRIEVEKKIISALVKQSIEAGYLITVHNGEEDTIEHSISHDDIMKSIMTTDEEWLYMYKPGEKNYFGWVYLVYGNDGWDVISDYTTNLEHIWYDALRKVC